MAHNLIPHNFMVGFLNLTKYNKICDLCKKKTKNRYVCVIDEFIKYVCKECVDERTK